MAISAKVKAMLAASQVTTTEEMEGTSGGVSRITLRKSKFTLKHDGEENVLKDPHLDVVILSISPKIGFTHTYYEAGYTPGAAEAPDCSSLNGTHPDRGVGQPQSDLCRKCPQQVWGSAKSMSGGKAKACKDSKHLYVKLAEELDDDAAPIYLLNVTIMSLRAFGAYGKALHKDGITTPVIVITRLEFDDAADVPVLTFENLGLLDDDSCELAINQSVAHGEELHLTLSQASSAALEADPGTKAIEQSKEILGIKKDLPDDDIDSVTQNW